MQQLEPDTRPVTGAHKAIRSALRRLVRTAPALLFFLPATACPARALQPGDGMPAFSVEAGGKAAASGGLAGRVAVITYEDRAAVEVNRLFKRALLQRWRQGDPSGPAIVPVVDCASFFGFTRSICAGRVAEAGKKEKLTIYADTDGGMARAFQVQDGRSNLFIIDKKGVVRFARAGRLDAAAVQETIRLIERLLEE